MAKDKYGDDFYDKYPKTGSYREAVGRGVGRPTNDEPSADESDLENRGMQAIKGFKMGRGSGAMPGRSND